MDSLTIALKGIGSTNSRVIALQGLYSISGPLYYPSPSNVRHGVTYGSSGELSGSFRFNAGLSIFNNKYVIPTNLHTVIGHPNLTIDMPSENLVRKGVVYGDSNQYTGTALGFVSIKSDTAVIVKPITEKTLITL